mmetsp:Transcript_10589/g.21760  ORF Transcript_10589/g.21760 Transcript_10589/m.21760 type:complete len:80 (-) Transcript_10589:98-337(-)
MPKSDNVSKMLLKVALLPNSIMYIFFGTREATTKRKNNGTNQGKFLQKKGEKKESTQYTFLYYNTHLAGGGKGYKRKID